MILRPKPPASRLASGRSRTSSTASGLRSFWDRVMQEIAELIAERGPFTPNEILPQLRAVTLRGATLHKEPLTPGTLRKKMDVRVSFGR